MVSVVIIVVVEASVNPMPVAGLLARRWDEGYRRAQLTGELNAVRALTADAAQKMGYTNVWSLAGGYKAFRGVVIAELAALPQRFTLRVIVARTGSGKTRLLHALRDADPPRGAGPAIDVLLSALPEALKPRAALHARETLPHGRACGTQDDDVATGRRCRAGPTPPSCAAGCAGRSPAGAPRAPPRRRSA